LEILISWGETYLWILFIVINLKS